MSDVMPDAEIVSTVDPWDTSPAPVDRPLNADLLAAAEAARRAAHDAVVGTGTLSMPRLREADRAGSEAFLTALGE